MNDVRRCLIEFDVAGMRALWRQQSPHLPQPNSDAEALTSMHHARTLAESVPFRLRAYSHRWLTDRGLPSGLPDRLRPRAEQVVPKVEEGVGIAVMSASPVTQPVVGEVRDAMSDAVLECYADGHREAEVVRPRMIEARDRTLKKLLGITR